MAHHLFFNLFSDSIHIVPSDSVWPGDANKNGYCDGTDLLTLGLNYGSTGIARDLQDNDWYAHPATNWAPAGDTLDLKFSDCNGDGTIDLNDTLAINLNFFINARTYNCT